MIPAYSFEQQLKFLMDLAEKAWVKEESDIFRMALSLAESVKAARAHQDCIAAASLKGE